ncbi:MAG: hypothetical protein ACM3W4_03470, partial [Ignavibacteriales bacterium]
MKKAFAAALTISLLAGTSAFAQERHQRGEGGDWRERAAQHQQEAAQRQDDRRPPREHSDETRPSRPVPQVANPRAQEAIAEARARQAQHDAAVVERRNDRANEAIAGARARQADRNEEQHLYIGRDRSGDRRRQAEERQRHVVPRVTPQVEQRRYERRDEDREQHVYIRPDARRSTEAARR